MSRPDAIVTDCSMTPGADVIEVELLLSAHQFSALEAAAARSDRTVAALLRGAISDFLKANAAGRTVAALLRGAISDFLKANAAGQPSV